jgi:hypothetical protein
MNGMQNAKSEKTSAYIESEMKNNFVKAFSACIKAKGYSIN